MMSYYSSWSFFFFFFFKLDFIRLPYPTNVSIVVVGSCVFSFLYIASPLYQSFFYIIIHLYFIYNTPPFALFTSRSLMYIDPEFYAICLKGLEVCALLI